MVKFTLAEKKVEFIRCGTISNRQGDCSSFESSGPIIVTASGIGTLMNREATCSKNEIRHIIVQ